MTCLRRRANSVNTRPRSSGPGEYEKSVASGTSLEIVLPLLSWCDAMVYRVSPADLLHTQSACGSGMTHGQEYLSGPVPSQVFNSITVGSCVQSIYGFGFRIVKLSNWPLFHTWQLR